VLLLPLLLLFVLVIGGGDGIVALPGGAAGIAPDTLL